MSLRNILKGTGVAVVTPFAKNGAVDYDALGKLLDYIIGNNVEYIVTLGTTGETPVLTTKEKIDIIQATYAHVNSRVPVIVGIGGNNTHEVVEQLAILPLKDATAMPVQSVRTSRCNESSLRILSKAPSVYLDTTRSFFIISAISYQLPASSFQWIADTLRRRNYSLTIHTLTPLSTSNFHNSHAQFTTFTPKSPEGAL